MSLQKLKVTIQSLGNTSKVTKAMQNIAATKVHKLREKLIASKANLSHLRVVNPKFFSTVNQPINITASTINKTKIIVFSPKKGLCGGLARRIAGDYINFTRNFLSEFSNSQLIGVELATSFLLAEGNFRFERCFWDLSDGSMATANIYQDIINQIQENNQIVLIYPKIINHQLITNHCHYQYTDSQVDKLCLFGILEEAWNETRFCEETKRIEAMQQASDNCKKLKEASQLKYFKLRQTKITQEILEIS